MLSPYVTIKQGGVDLVPAWGPLLIGVTVTDERGLESDKCQIELDDRGGRIAYPGTGETIEIEGGYREWGAALQGEYVIDQIELDGWPQRITLHGASVAAKAASKQRRTQAYGRESHPTVGSIVSDVARRSGWTPSVASQIASLPNLYEAQTEESDTAFLTRLLARHDALVTVKQGRLVITPRAALLTASGAPMAALVVEPDANLLEYRVSWKDRPSHGKVVARHFDRGLAEPVELEVGAEGASAEEVAFRFREPFQSREDAERAAAAKARELARAEGSAIFTIEGDPRFAAEVPVLARRIRSGVDGLWIPSRVEHRWTESDYKTGLECEPPGQGDSRNADAEASGAQPASAASDIELQPPLQDAASRARRTGFEGSPELPSKRPGG